MLRITRDAGASGASRAALAGALAIAIVTIVAAQTPADDAKAQAARAAERIRVLQKEADALAAQARTIFGELRRLELEREIKQTEMLQAERELTRVSAERDVTAARLKALEATRVAETPGVRERLIELAKRGRGGYVQLLLASDDVRAFGRLSRGVAAVAELDRVRLETHRRTIAAERAALDALEKQRAAVAASQKEAQRARASLDAAVASRNRLISDLDTRRDLAAQFVDELQSAQAELERTIASAGSAAAPNLPIRPFRGDLPWPAAGPVVARFGRATSGRFATSIVRNGIDIGMAEGAPAAAVHEGSVAYAAPFSGFGVLVIVDHGGSAFTLYGHLSEALVTPGKPVRRGDVVGKVGLAPTGEATLYFELRIDGRPVDPLQWLRSQK